MNMGISGGAMLHAGGVTLMHSPGDTMVLVEAKNADGVHIQQQNGVAIDGNGYAVLTAADAWHYNVVSLNTADIGAGLDIPQAQKKIVPTEKAIGKVVFETFSGRNYLVNAVMPGNIAPRSARTYEIPKVVATVWSVCMALCMPAAWRTILAWKCAGAPMQMNTALFKCRITITSR